MVAGRLQEKNGFYYMVAQLYGRKRKAEAALGFHRVTGEGQ